MVRRVNPDLALLRLVRGLVGQLSPARVQAFLEAYAAGLCAAVTKRPHNYALKPDDTSQSYAVRVAVTTAGLVEQSGLTMLRTEADGFRRACKLLGIEHSEDAIRAYLEG